MRLRTHDRIYIFGPSGSGTTTLAARYAEENNCYHLDTDDYFWEDTNPPYKKAVSLEQRVSRILEVLREHENWVISGCMCSWGGSILDLTTTAVFLWIPWELRRKRLRQRECQRFGEGCIDEGGRRCGHYQEFEDWAKSYDTADVSMRSRQRHELWIEQYTATGRDVIRMECDESVEVRLNHLLSLTNQIK